MTTKIYADDPLVPYRNTKVGALTTKAEIDGILARWGVKDAGWRWDLDKPEVFIIFEIRETADDNSESYPKIKVEAPLIYNKASRKNPKEAVNWNVSMRTMYWYIKSHLEAAYLWRIQKTREFLPNARISLPNGKEISLGEIFMNKLNLIDKIPALAAMDQRARNDVVIQDGVMVDNE